MKAKPYQYGVKIWCLATLNTSLCKKWKFIMVQVMRMLNMQFGRKLSLNMNIRIRITLSNVIKKKKLTFTVLRTFENWGACHKDLQD
jgi:hypothetical protein